MREGEVKPGSGSTHAGQRVSGRRRLAAGEPRRGGGLGNGLQSAVWRAEHGYGMRTLVRIQPWGRRGRGVALATSLAAACAGELRAVATELEREKGEDGKVARLTVVATERTARSGANCCGGDGGGDLRR